MGAESRKRIIESKRRRRGNISSEESDEYESVDDIDLSSQEDNDNDYAHTQQKKQAELAAS